jgi:hypothetical protein
MVQSPADILNKGTSERSQGAGVTILTTILYFNKTKTFRRGKKTISQRDATGDQLQQLRC